MKCINIVLKYFVERLDIIASILTSLHILRRVAVFIAFRIFKNELIISNEKNIADRWNNEF